MNTRGIKMRTALLGMLISIPAYAEEKAPKLTGLFPHGASRGKTVTVSASGEFPSWPLDSWLCEESERDTNLTCKALPEKGKLEISIPGDARPGIYWLRLYNRVGASSPRPFLVSDLPDVIEEEPNNSSNEAPHLEKPSLMIHGRLEKKGDVDSYSVDLQDGDVLVADLTASRVLASPMDGSLQITSVGGFILTENDDDQGMDPRIVFRAPAPGRYIVRLFAFPAKPNSSIQFSGGSDYIYRLALTTGPFIEYSYPLAVGLAAPAEVALHGWNIPEDRKTIKIAANGGRGLDLVRIPGAANAALLAREDCKSITEEEYAKMGRLPEPTGTLIVSGRISSPGERDTYVFSAPGKENFEVSVTARRVGSLLDPVLMVKDADSKTVAEKDDTDSGLDCTTQFTTAENKTYRIEVRDRFSHGGRRFFYMLRIARPARAFSLKLASDSFVLDKGKKLEIPVTVDRRGGYEGKILITATGLPEGVSSTTAESLHGKDSAKAVKIVLEGDSTPLDIPFRIRGSDGADGAETCWAGYNVPGRKAPLTKAWLTVKGE